MELCENLMELKDIISIFIFIIVLVVLVIVIYLLYWYKSFKVIFCFNSRFFDCLNEKIKWELRYIFSNIGN